MLIADWDISKVRPYPNNPRVLRNAAEKVAESIREFGWRQPVVVDAEGVIIIGHARLEAAKLLKLKTVPVHVADGLNEAQVRALRIADNKTSEFAEWDDAKLSDELAAIMESVGNVSVTGFSQSEFDALEMKSRAAMVELGLVEPDQPNTTDESDDADDFEDDPPKGDDPENDDEPTATGGGDELPPQDMVPFNVLMGVDERQVVYDAIAKAKEKHGLERSGDALLVIARAYLND